MKSTHPFSQSIHSDPDGASNGLSRRDLLRSGGYVGAATFAAAALPQSAHAITRAIRNMQAVHQSEARLAGPRIDDPAIKALALRAIDAAKSAGAIYADVRITRTEKQVLNAHYPSQWRDQEELAIGVRALVNGYWGFAASSVWTNEEATRLANHAVAQAKTNAKGTPRMVELGQIPIVKGAWTMPVKRDPFTVPLEERFDFLCSWENTVREYNPRTLLASPYGEFVRQGRALATSEGSYVTQTVYETAGGFVWSIRNSDWRSRDRAKVWARGFSVAGKGWELFTEGNPHGQIPRMHEEAQELLRTPVKPAELGRFDVVMDASVVAQLVDQTIGMATELDRAMGYEANADGTSYLSKPLAMLGTYKVGNPLVAVTGNRTAPGGAATVQWDDEGIVPNEMTLVRDGIANDFQTTREQAAWLAPWYQQQQTPVRSHGCAGAASAMDITMQRSPNLVLRPGDSQATFAELVANTKKGVAICRAHVTTDFQSRNGSVGGDKSLFREIVDGKLGAVLGSAAVLFNTAELWNNVMVLGGASSAESIGQKRIKGQPSQTMVNSVSAVPMSVKNVAIIDAKRKA